MGKHKKLTREEYAEKFEKLLFNYNYIMQEGEKIVQCIPPHPDYWFISNKGRLFSAYRNNIEVLMPNFDETGKANKEGKRAGKCWRYATKKEGDKNLTRFDMGIMMAEYFGENEFDIDEETEVHHIQKRNTFDKNEAQKCNSADNLQVLPKSVHTRLSHYAGKTNEELDEEMQKKLINSGCPVLCFQNEHDLEQFIVNAINYAVATGGKAVSYSMTLADDPANIKAEAHPITHAEMID